MIRPQEHYVTTCSFVVECVCGRIFSERTEAQARRRHDEHREEHRRLAGASTEPQP